MNLNGITGKGIKVGVIDTGYSHSSMTLAQPAALSTASATAAAAAAEERLPVDQHPSCSHGLLLPLYRSLPLTDSSRYSPNVLLHAAWADLADLV